MNGTAQRIEEYDRKTIEILLRDHSRDSKGEVHNIIWATDDYKERGHGFLDEIGRDDITGENENVVTPRVRKEKKEREKRTKEKAEVFTPTWICNKQNNLVDEAWFGEKDIINTEDDGSKSWRSREGRIPFPTKDGKEWTEYIRNRVLEITCGEAPYLTTRYDTTDGREIGIKERCGLLDRKLRVTGENTETREEWWRYAMLSLKNTYGYEWQGDSLLIARMNVLRTTIEHYAKFCKEKGLKPETEKEETKERIRQCAEIISWNLLQMDGLKMTIPETCHEDKRIVIKQTKLSLFDEEKGEDTEEEITVKCPGCERNDIMLHNGIPAILAAWDEETGARIEGTMEFRELLKDKEKNNK